MRHHLLLAAALAIFTFGIAGCTSVPERHPLPANLVDQAQVPGGEGARSWGDAPPPLVAKLSRMTKEEARQSAPGLFGHEHHYLAISGTGANGAYGAGLLCGWTEAGTRPEFTVVTGVGTGALIAPFAFLGSDYDHVLRKFYTTICTEDVLDQRSLINALTSDAAAGSEPLQKLLAELVTDEVVKAIATEYEKGRHLSVGTTNLDAGRPVRWNLGRIAASGDPRATELIRQLLLASASVPGAFPPVLVEVEAGGATYDEMHMEGGATAQIYIYPTEVDWERVLRKLEVPGRPNLYLIRNAMVAARYETVNNEIFAIIGRSLSSMIRTQGIASMYDIYLKARRDHLDYHLAYIPGTFEVKPREVFDQVYMQALFDLGFTAARSGYRWEKTPPGYDAAAEGEFN
jgi:Patatin-like phospholipase